MVTVIENSKSKIPVCLALSIIFLAIKSQCTTIPVTGQGQKNLETPSGQGDLEITTINKIKESTSKETIDSSVKAAEMGTTNLHDAFTLSSTTLSDETLNFTYDENKFLEAVQNQTHMFLFEEKRREDAFLFFDAKHHPFAVVLVSNSYSICSGTLVAADWVLTAAHCLTRIRSVWVYGGLLINAFKVNHENLPPGVKVIASSEFYVHPYYNSRTDDYDLGLIKLRPPFQLNEYTYPLRLTDTPWPQGPPRTCVNTAFGSVHFSGSHKYDHMRKTQQLEVVKPCPCEGYLRRTHGPAADRQLCKTKSWDKGVCPGDSGSGLVCNFMVCGVASYLQNVGNCQRRVRRQTCGDPNTLSVFQDVYPSLPWIRKYVPPWTLSRGRGFTDQEDSKNITDALNNANQRNFPTISLLMFVSFLACIMFN